MIIYGDSVTLRVCTRLRAKGGAHPREYPVGFGLQLLKITKNENFRANPQPCLRQKCDLSGFDSELALFRSLPTGDVWSDAELPAVYFYLAKSKHLVIPVEWRATMGEFTEELRSVTGLIL